MGDKTMLARLKKYRDSLAELEEERERLLSLEAQLFRMTSQITGMPRGSAEQDRMAAMIARRIEIQAIIQDNVYRLDAERRELEQYVSELSDPVLRRIIRLRYFRGLSWVAIGHKMGSMSESGVRSILSRWFDRTE